MELGPQFEDSLFVPSRERRSGGGAGAGAAGGARHCEPGWFRGADGGDGCKFRADWAYRQRDFEDTDDCKICLGFVLPDPCEVISLCQVNKADKVVFDPLIHCHQWLLHTLKALYEYSDCLQLLPPSNIAMRRDVQEGQARCLSHLGRHKEALEIAEKMRNSATNTDHLTTILNLQFSIYQGVENVEKKILCLQQLICLHPFNPWFWKFLAEAYMSLLQNLSPLGVPGTNLNCSEDVGVSDSSFKTSTGREINLHPHRSDSQKEGPWSSLAAETKGENAVTCSSSQVVKEFLCTSGELERTEEGKCTDSESWKQNRSKKVQIKACASFIRARLLLQLTQPQQSSFVLESNRKGQKEIDDKVARLGFDEKSLMLMTKVMGQDLIPEKLKEEFQGEVKCMGPSALSSLVNASVMEFEVKWFSNLQDDLCNFGSQFYSDIYVPPSVT